MSNLDHGLQYDKLRVLDFYFLFPHFIKEIKPWPNDIRGYKSVASSVSDSFEKVSNKRRLFFEMMPVQNMALAIMKSKGFLKVNGSEGGLLYFQKDLLPSRIKEIREFDEFVDAEVFDLIVRGLASTDWEGASGLKRRSGLLEYKYDE
ncbi:hypothetical protein JF541_07280 [Marinobacter hydrocarbonoclasticus]|uniref:ABC-three component system middle component 5 n=1 Tax=Marinobacter nauticus TaxID=2743 RepID=UPI001A8D08F1|nr:ABC-three component system middle component 5 [Marinobacter nauticus]MBN8238940.1 hypothetical protein [Marinobacter nauticus]